MKKGQKLRPSFFVFAFCVFIFLTGCGGLSGISIKNIEQEKNYYQSFINYPPLPREARRLVIHNPQQAIQSKKIISPIILSPGWNTISFPYKQINSTSGFSYYLYKFNGSGYDEIDPVNHPEAIDCHYGYWTYSENVIEVHVEGVNNVSPDRLIKIKLLSGWNFLGVPFEAAQPFEGVRVQSSEEVKYLTQVVSVDVPHGPDDWLYACVYNFSDASWKTQNILQSGTLEPGKGYWFWSWRDVELYYELPGWTFLVYMDGTNDLESKADEDFNEMLQIGSNEEIKIIVQQSKLSEDGRVKRWDIIQESPSILADLGVLDMSDPSTINNFITWGMRTYPAENYALVLWNHGAGWKNKGIITDDINSQTTTMLELKTALTGLPNRLNIIVCDASLMQMIECAYQIKQYADYLVAS
ncbi:MAG: hypothetical protein GYA14_14980 [Ignavibacteria bacterium]|nr:hypothetical protein [Ignavibacteria bacterium]